jgi:hypothetical protein
MAMSSMENAVNWEALVHQHVKHPHSVRPGKKESLVASSWHGRTCISLPYEDDFRVMSDRTSASPCNTLDSQA